MSESNASAVCVEPWGESPEFVGRLDGSLLPCDTLVELVVCIYTGASFMLAVALCFQIAITRSLDELKRAGAVLVAVMMCLSVTVPRSALVRSESDYFYVDLGFTLRWQLAAVLLYAMLGTFLSKFIQYLKKQCQSMGSAMSARQVRMIRLAPRIFVSQIAITLLVSVPISVAATAHGPETRVVLLRVGMLIDGLVKLLNIVAVSPVLRLTVRQLLDFRRATTSVTKSRIAAVGDSGSGGRSSKPQADPVVTRIDGLIARMRGTRFANEVYVAVNVPPLLIGAAFPATMQSLRYLYPLSYLVGAIGIFTSTFALYRKGVRRQRRADRNSVSAKPGEQLHQHQQKSFRSMSTAASSPASSDKAAATTNERAEPGADSHANIEPGNH
jgi:hypothetical protein